MSIMYREPQGTQPRDLVSTLKKVGSRGHAFPGDILGGPWQRNPEVTLWRALRPENRIPDFLARRNVLSQKSEGEMKMSHFRISRKRRRPSVSGETSVPIVSPKVQDSGALPHGIAILDRAAEHVLWLLLLHQLYPAYGRETVLAAVAWIAFRRIV